MYVCQSCRACFGFLKARQPTGFDGCATWRSSYVMAESKGKICRGSRKHLFCLVPLLSRSRSCDSFSRTSYSTGDGQDPGTRRGHAPVQLRRTQTSAESVFYTTIGCNRCFLKLETNFSHKNLRARAATTLSTFFQQKLLL